MSPPETQYNKFVLSSFACAGYDGVDDSVGRMLVDATNEIPPGDTFQLMVEIPQEQSPLAMKLPLLPGSGNNIIVPNASAAVGQWSPDFRRNFLGLTSRTAQAVSGLEIENEIKKDLLRCFSPDELEHYIRYSSSDIDQALEWAKRLPRIGSVSHGVFANDWVSLFITLDPEAQLKIIKDMIEGRKRRASKILTLLFNLSILQADMVMRPRNISILLDHSTLSERYFKYALSYPDDLKKYETVLAGFLIDVIQDNRSPSSLCVEEIIDHHGDCSRSHFKRLKPDMDSYGILCRQHSKRLAALIVDCIDVSNPFNFPGDSFSAVLQSRPVPQTSADVAEKTIYELRRATQAERNNFWVRLVYSAVYYGRISTDELASILAMRKVEEMLYNYNS